MAPILSRKAESFTESVIREMTRLNLALNGPEKAVNFAQGFPDFPASAEIIEAAKRALDEGYNQYATTWGAPQLRKAIAAKQSRWWGRTVDPDSEVTVACGATEAMIAALLAAVDPGDEVVVFEPFYENYGPDCILSGAVPRYVALRAPDWSFDEGELRAAFSARTRAIVVNTPHNPTGKVFSREELTLIARLCQEHDAIAITDEIYEHLVYRGEHISMATLPGMADRTITISGASKTYSVTGWRVGWLIASKDLAAAAANLQSHATSNVSNVAQRAALAAVSGDLAAVDEMKAAFDRRRKTIVSMLNEIEGVLCPTPQGAFYAYPSVKGLLGREYDGRLIETSADLAEYILEQAEVAIVPGEAFGTPGYLRLSYALGDDDLVEGITRLQKLFA